MNPLLNRIYENKNRKHSQGNKHLNSSIDKVLVPKLNTKLKLEAINGPQTTERQKTTIIKPYIGKLPSLHRQKQDELSFQTDKKLEQGKSRGDFRSRRLSSHLRDNETSYLKYNDTSLLKDAQISIEFASEHKVGFQPNKISFQSQRQTPITNKTKTLANQSPSIVTEPFVIDSSSKKIRHPTQQTPLNQNNKTQTRQPLKKNITQDYDQQDELFQYLCILQTNQDLNEQFCYMNRGPRPYSFYIVDYDSRNLEEYLTVSLRGVTYHKIEDEEAEDEFFTIQALHKDVQRYKVIRHIPFFKNYVIQKALNHWKTSMFRKKFINQCQFLKDNLFSQNEVNLRYFQTLHELYNQFCKGNFLQMNIVSTLPSLPQLINSNMANRFKQMTEDFTIFQTQVRQNLMQCLTQNMTRFRKQKRVTLGTSDKLQKAESFLPFDNKKKMMKFTQLAKLKEFEGYLYKIIKLTDMVRYNVKVEFAKSSLGNSIREIEVLLANYQNRQSRAFVSWVECHVRVEEKEAEEVVIDEEPKQSQVSFLTSSDIGIQNKVPTQSKTIKRLTKAITFLPSPSQLKQSFLQHKQQCLKHLYTEHKFLTEQKDQLLCNEYQLEERQRPTTADLKYYLQRQPELVELNARFQETLDVMLGKIEGHKKMLEGTLLKIYSESFLKEPIENYLRNQRLKAYLDGYLIDKDVIEKTEDFIEFGLVLLRIQSFKAEVKKVYDQKYKAIVTAIPQEVLKRTQSLARDVRDVYFKFKTDPSTIKEFIEFSKLFHEEKSKMPLLEKRIEDLLELQTMIHSNGIKIAQHSRAHIAQSQSLFRELQRRFQEIDQNEEKERKKFEVAIDAIIPNIEEKSEDLVKELQAHDVLHNPNSLIQTVMEKLKDFTDRFQRIRSRKQELFLYQIQLNLGHKDLENFFKLQIIFDWYTKLWNGHKSYLQIQAITKQKGYGQIQSLQTTPLVSHLKNLQNAQSDIQALQLIQQFREKTTRLLHVIKLARLIATETFQPDHCEQIRKIMTFSMKKVKDLIFTREGSRTITCEDFYANTNIVEIQKQVAEIAFLSAQENIIKKKLTEIEDFWKKTKVKFISEDIIGNGTPILHLDQNQELHQKIGLFNLNLKNIQNSGHAQGLVLERLEMQLKVTVYLRKLLFIWGQVEKQWLKLLPLMTNCPSVKHQSNVYFQFTSVDSMMKKLIKQISDMSSMRKLIEDHSDKKNIHTLERCSSELKAINKTFQNFLQAKRATYNRFYFLTDEQLISIIQNVKDSRSIAKYGGFCFNCDELDMDNELINGFKTDNQIYKLRKVMLRGEPDEMFKSISENMKSSMKFAVRNMIPKMKIAINIEQQLRDNSLQVCLLCDLLIWTQMTETYLNATSYDEYQLITKRPAEEMAKLLPKISKDLWIRLAIRLCQASYLKEISETLIIDQVTRNDFKWKQQIKYSLEQDQIVIRQFDSKMIHGLEYYPPQKIFIPTLNTQRLLYESYHACLNHKLLAVNGHQGQGKRNLMKYTSSRVGVYYKEVVCNSNLKTNYLMRFVHGAVQLGAWLSFYQCSNLKSQVVYQLFDNISKLKTQDKCHPRTLFMVVNHGQKYQKISMFKYHNYNLVEPDHKKICEALFQMNRFRDWQELSKKILSFLKAIKPLMQNIMGSHLSLIRKIVDGAGRRKVYGKNSESQNNMVVAMIRKQIIDKSEQNVAIVLKKALVSYFNTSQQTIDPKKQYRQKVGVLKQIIQRKESRNIIVIGNRSCKSTLISQALHELNLDPVKLFPEAQTEYLTPYSIDYLNLIPFQKVLIYDGDQVISQFTDIITSGYLLVEGRKVVIRNKIILELRNISNCSPSFIQNCQTIYVGNVVDKVQKFMKYCTVERGGDVFQVLQEVFGEELYKLNQNDIETVARFINRYKAISHLKSLHKLLIWLMSVLSNEELWQRNYSGKFTDYTVHEKFLELIPVDPSKHHILKHYETNFSYIPTKSAVLITELTSCLLNVGLHVHITGGQQIGKTTLIKLLKGTKINLSIYNKTEYWGEFLKDKLLIVRKDAKNYLMPVGQASYKVIVDDLDLGQGTHHTFLRGLVHAAEIRDSKYHRYLLEQFQVIVTSRANSFNSKIDQTLVKIPLISQSKESLSTIFLTNVEHFVKSHNMNREVIDYFERTVLKSLLIAFDDLSNLSNPNVATAHLISILKDLLSIPKKNSFISVEDFTSLFKSLFYQKLTQKSFNKRIKWQLNSVYENITKIVFNNDQEWNYWINLDSHFRKTTTEQATALITEKFKNLIVYPEMIEKIIFINNQLQSINSKIAMIGRKGVGKRHISRISASLNKLQSIYTIRDAIFNAIKNQPCVLLQQVKRNITTIFQQLHECQVDSDLEKYLELHEREKIRQHMNSSDGFESIEILTKIKKFVKIVVLLDDKHEYLTVCERFRDFCEFTVCILDQWPIQAIINVYKTVDGNQRIHAQIFLGTNEVLFQNGLHFMPMTFYQKYIEIFDTIYQNKKTSLQQKKDNLTAMYNKFNESCAIIRDWQKKVGTLEMQITETIQDLSKHIEIDKINAKAAAQLKQQLGQKQREIKEKKDKLEEAKDLMEDQLKHTKKILEKIEKILSSLQRTQMSELKKIYRTNKLVEFGLECLCILIKDKQDQINDKTINKILADPNLLMKMKSPQMLAVKNMYLITKFKKQITGHENLLKNHTTQTAKILVEWIRSIIQYWETTDLYTQKRKEYRVLEDQYNIVSQDYEKTELDLRKVTEKAKAISQQLVKLQQQKSAKEHDLLSINSKLQNSSEIIPILLKAEQQIQTVLKKLNIYLSNLVGNVTLVAFTAAFLPLRRLTIKSKMLDTAKKILRKQYIAYSDSFLHQIIPQSIFVNDFNEDYNSIEDLNIFLVESFPQKIKIIIDPERKAFNYLQSYEKKTLHHLLDLIVEKAEDLKEEEFTPSKVYHSTTQNLLIQYEKCLILDWKTIETNPQQRLFNRIAFSKKPEYFQTKKQLSQKVEDNLRKIDDMKKQLYQVICQSAIKILDDEKFLENGKHLIQLQEDTKNIEKQIVQKVKLIQTLEKQINSEVKSIFILLRHFKQIRPIGLDLILDAASKEGDSIQNVISWALGNLPIQKRSAYLLAVANEFSGKDHEELLHQIIYNAPLKHNDVKMKKPSLVNIANWEKLLKISSYSESLKQMLDIVLKHQKQFEGWINNFSLTLPTSLTPQKLSMNEHLFLIYNFKPQVFSQSVNFLVGKCLSKYQLKPARNASIFAESNKLFPVVYHSTISKLQKLCEQVNESKMERIRIGTIRTQSQMRKKIWKCMQHGEWMVIYGITCLQDIDWVQRIVYYVINYQTQPGFRIVIMQNGLKTKSNDRKTLIESSKYLTSISVHLYDEIPQYLELMKLFELYNEAALNLPHSTSKQKTLSILFEQQALKTPRISSRHRNRKSSLHQQANNDKVASLLFFERPSLSIGHGMEKQPMSLLNLPQDKTLQNTSFVLTTKVTDKFLNRLYKHLLLAHLVIVRKYGQKIEANSFEILQRCIKILKYIEQNSIAIEFNVESIVGYLQKLYSIELAHEDRKSMEEIMERIVDEMKFNEKLIYGVNLANFLNVESQLQNNSQITGNDDSIFLRQSSQKSKQLMKNLDQMLNPMDLQQSTVFLRTFLGKIPILLANKQIKNENYFNFYLKQEKFHNDLLKKTEALLNWINTYANKNQNGEEVQPENQYNWQNLIRQVQRVVGFRFSRNQLHDVVNNFTINLKKSHDFLLYFNPAHLAYEVNPYLVSNFESFVSTFTINYFSANHITDAFNYVPNLEFKKISSNEMNQYVTQYGVGGIIFINFKYRDFKFNSEFKTLEPLAGSFDGQQKSPIVMYRFRKLMNSQKQEQETVVNIPIKLKTTLRSDCKEKVLLNIPFMCNGVYPEFYLRDNSLVLQDNTN